MTAAAEPRGNPPCRCGHDADHHPVRGRTTQHRGPCSLCWCPQFQTDAPTPEETR